MHATLPSNASHPSPHDGARVATGLALWLAAACAVALSGVLSVERAFLVPASVAASVATLVSLYLAGGALRRVADRIELRALVLFHSAFQLRTPIATVSTASLALVVVTGLVGRFLYALAPAGDRERLRAALDAMPPAQRAELANAIQSQPGPNVPANASLLRSVLAIPAWRRASKTRRTMIAAILSAHGDADRAAKVELMRAASAEARASGVSALLRSWRAIHRFFALLMLTAVVLHAGVAWYYGYRWIFG